MQFRFLLLALISNSALSFAAEENSQLETFTLSDGQAVELDPSTVVDALEPGDGDLAHSRPVNGPMSARRIFERQAAYCPPGETLCNNGNICCYKGNICCEGRSCVNTDTHNCCLYGYSCEKPFRCLLNNAGNVYCGR